MRNCCPFKTAQKQFIKCQFYIGFEPLWAWVCSMLDRQDAINELFYYVLRAIGAETAARRPPFSEMEPKPKGRQRDCAAASVVVVIVIIYLDEGHGSDGDTIEAEDV